MVNVVRTYDRFGLYEFLKAVTVITPNGNCEYKPGWTDTKLAMRFGTHRTTVARLRNSQFGSLNPSTERTLTVKPGIQERTTAAAAATAAAVSGFDTRLMQLEAAAADPTFANELSTLAHRITQLEARMTDIAAAVRRLIETTHSHRGKLEALSPMIRRAKRVSRI